MKKIIAIFLVLYTIIEIIATLDGTISFLNRIGIKITEMQIVTIAKIISDIFHFITPILVLGCIYYILKLKEYIIDLKKYTDTHIEEFEEIINFKVAADKKQIEHIFKTLKATTSPIDLLDSEAVRVHTENQNKRKDIMNEIDLKFKKLIK